jgi:MFS family permease
VTNTQASTPARCRGENFRARQAGAILALLFGHFALLGITVGAQGVLWAVLMPQLRLSKAAFGSAQLVSPLISVGLLVLGGQLAGRQGKKRLALASLFFLATASLTLGVIGNFLGFVAALALLGVGNGLFEVAMNGTALDWEQATGRSALSLLHGAFSAAAGAGALGTGELLAAGWSPARVLTVLGLLAGALMVPTISAAYPRTGTGGTSRVPVSTLGILFSTGALRLLALATILGAFVESVANVWSVIFLHERGAGTMTGALAFALLSAAMLVGRLANAPLLDRLGAAASMQLSGLALVASSILLVLPGGTLQTIGAFIIMGLGVAGIVPTVLTAGARHVPGQTGAVAGGVLAAVYVSFAIAPPLIGYLGDLLSLRVALLLVGLSGLGIVRVARAAV